LQGAADRPCQPHEQQAAQRTAAHQQDERGAEDAVALGVGLALLIEGQQPLPQSVEQQKRPGHLGATAHHLHRAEVVLGEAARV